MATAGKALGTMKVLTYVASLIFLLSAVISSCIVRLCFL